MSWIVVIPMDVVTVSGFLAQEGMVKGKYCFFSTLLISHTLYLSLSPSCPLSLSSYSIRRICQLAASAGGRPDVMRLSSFTHQLRHSLIGQFHEVSCCHGNIKWTWLERTGRCIIYLSASLSVCSSLCMSVCSSLCTSICLSVCSFLCMSVCPSVCLSISQTVHKILEPMRACYHCATGRLLQCMSV